MRRLTLRERGSLPIGPDGGLSDAEAAKFAQLQPSVPAGSISWEHRAIRFGPFCGVLRAGSKSHNRLSMFMRPPLPEGEGWGEGIRNRE